PQRQALLRQPGPGVEELGLMAGIEEELVLVLSMEVDQKIAQGPELGEEYRAAVHRGAALSLPRDLTAHDHAALLLHHLRIERADGFQEVGPAGEIEHALHETPLRSGANPFGVGALSEQQRDRSDDERFAGAGLSGQDVQAGIEGELEAIHERESLNGEPDQHRITRAPWCGSADPPRRASPAAPRRRIRGARRAWRRASWRGGSRPGPRPPGASRSGRRS